MRWETLLDSRTIEVGNSCCCYSPARTKRKEEDHYPSLYSIRLQEDSWMDCWNSRMQSSNCHLDITRSHYMLWGIRSIRPVLQLGNWAEGDELDKTYCMMWVLSSSTMSSLLHCLEPWCCLEIGKSNRTDRNTNRRVKDKVYTLKWDKFSSPRQKKRGKQSWRNSSFSHVRTVNVAITLNTSDDVKYSEVRLMHPHAICDTQQIENIACHANMW